MNRKTACRRRNTTFFPASRKTGGSISRSKRQTIRQSPPIFANTIKQVVPIAKKNDLDKKLDHLFSFCEEKGGF
ncbi:MAG: hypothetical protein Q4C07_03045 [Eubacteriales bacterium]|nr:hypothetical protein [Eubacteriales bacterium]